MGYLDKSAKTNETQQVLQDFFKPRIWKLPDFNLDDKVISSSPQWLGIACEVVFYFSLLSQVPKEEQSPIEVLQYAYGFREEEIEKTASNLDSLAEKAWEHAAWRIPKKNKNRENPLLEQSAKEFLEKKFFWFKAFLKGVKKCDPRFFKLGGDANIYKDGRWEIIEMKNDSNSSRKKSWISQTLLLFLKKYYESVIKVDRSMFWVPIYYRGLPAPRKPAPAKDRPEKLLKHCISEDARVTILCPRPEIAFSFIPLKELRSPSKKNPLELVTSLVARSF